MKSNGGCGDLLGKLGERKVKVLLVWHLQSRTHCWDVLVSQKARSSLWGKIHTYMSYFSVSTEACCQETDILQQTLFCFKQLSIVGYHDFKVYMLTSRLGSMTLQNLKKSVEVLHYKKVQEENDIIAEDFLDKSAKRYSVFWPTGSSTPLLAKYLPCMIVGQKAPGRRT